MMHKWRRRAALWPLSLPLSESDSQKDAEYGDIFFQIVRKGKVLLGIMWLSGRQRCGETAMIVISPHDLVGVTIAPRCYASGADDEAPLLPGRLMASDSSQSAATNLPSLPRITLVPYEDWILQITTARRSFRSAVLRWETDRELS